MNLFLLLLRTSWKACLASVVLGAVAGPITMKMISVIHQALGQPDVNSAGLAIRFTLACAAVLVSQIVSKCILVRLSQSTAARLQYELCERVLAAPLMKLESLGVPVLLASVRNDVMAITGALAEFPTICASAMIVISGIGYLAYLSVPMALFTLTLAAVGVGTYLLGIKWGNYHMFRARAGQDDIFQQLHAFVYGIKELKGNDRRCTEFVFDVLLPADTSMRQRMIKASDIMGAVHSWGRMTIFLGIGLLVFVWPQFWPVSRATLAGYALTILFLTSPLDSILNWMPTLNLARICINKLKVFGLTIDGSDGRPVTRSPGHFESIELRGVSYQYSPPVPGEQGFRLGPFDLCLHPSEVLYIAGGNGSGKTTLVKLLTGLYEPHEGAVAWNGRDVDQQTLGNFRQLFATVFVEGHLFDRLLGTNVDPLQLKQWLSVLGIAEKVDVESGRLAVNALSRGQHKRLALLVALLDDRPVFVFDEWAAEQDPDFKEVFYRQIVPELKRRGKTVVVITHDDRYFFAADRVVKLVDGVLEPREERKAA